MPRVEGKVAVVSGGGSGIGKACAELLANEGASVAIADIDVEAADLTAADIVNDGGKVMAVELDVRDPDAWRTGLDLVANQFGPLNIMVNNAGIAVGTELESVSLDDWREVLATNLDSVMLGTQSAIRVVRESGATGSIINMSSVEGIVGHPMVTAYGASKGGIRAFTKSAALYCAQQGLPIRVNSVHPGGILTPMLQAGFSEHPPDVFDAMVAEHPIGRLGEPEGVAY
ncbi:MAG: SDR family NAD(P)-dependent oxidoreductase, partial [Pseudomonadota bacterium]